MNVCARNFNLFPILFVFDPKRREIAASSHCYVCRKAANTWAFSAACCSEDPCFVHPSATAAPAAVPPTIPLPLDISTEPPAVPRPSDAFDAPLAAPPPPALPSAFAPPPAIARGGRAGAAYNTFASPSRCCSMRKKKPFRCTGVRLPCEECHTNGNAGSMNQNDCESLQYGILSHSHPLAATRPLHR
jgi:hypothetical protein